jgi:hypothetical protein
MTYAVSPGDACTADGKTNSPSDAETTVPNDNDGVADLARYLVALGLYHLLLILQRLELHLAQQVHIFLRTQRHRHA